MRWKHLEETGYTYAEHFARAWGIGWKMIRAGGCCVIHAFVPSLFCDEASRTIKELMEIL